MSEEQTAELYEKLAAAKSKQAKAEQRFLCGWNAGIEFAIGKLLECCEESNEQVQD